MLNFNEFQEHIKNTILDYLPEEFSDAKVDLQRQLLILTIWI